jgi:hypothetical protein
MKKPIDSAGGDESRHSGRDGAAERRRPYAPPRVLSAEPLEAAAAVCDPPTPQGAGKSFPPCNPQQLGS